MTMTLGRWPQRERYPDVPLEQRRPHELVKLARKLRWIGMDEEADRVQAMLHKAVVPNVWSLRPILIRMIGF